jgi:hypothetical protein
MSYAKDCIIPYQSVLPKADQLITKVVEEPLIMTNATIGGVKMKSRKRELKALVSKVR